MYNNWLPIILSIDLLALFAVIVAIYAIKTNSKDKQRLIEASTSTVNKQAVIDETIPRILDLIITECFEDYKLLVLIPKNEFHINDKREAEIRRDLAEKVETRLSPVAVDKLSLYYNINNLDKIIGEKIYISVMSYVIEVNSLKDNLEEVPKNQ